MTVLRFILADGDRSGTAPCSFVCRTVSLVGLLPVLAVLTSCTRGSIGAQTPQIDPPAAAAAAIAQYDKDADGLLSASEIEDSALTLEKWDADDSGSIDKGEIEKRLQRYLDHGTGMAGLSCVVRYRNQPLADAQVTLKPEEFLGGAIHPAYGKTGSDGLAVLSVAEEFRPQTAAGQRLETVNVGLYTVEITHPEVPIREISPNAFEVVPFEEYPTPTFTVR